MKAIDITHLVFSGGGLKTISFLSALNYVIENKIISLKKLKSVSGTSAGAMVGLLLIIGFNTQEVIDLFKNTDFQSLSNIKMSNMFTYYGLDDAHNLMVWFIKEVTKKLRQKYSSSKNFCKITFHELYSLTKIKFNVTGTNVTKRELHYFNYETCKDMFVFDAIRITISIPFIYNCCPYKGDLYADGGLLNNFPIEITEKEALPDENILGIRILPYQIESTNTKLNLDEYVSSVVECLFYQIHKLSNKENSIFKYHTHANLFLLNINTSNNVFINFNTSLKEINELIEDGILCAKRWSLAQELNYFFE